MKLRDRYSYGDKLLPLLFAGIVDEVPKYQEQCKSYMNEIGALYEYDWEDRLKDQLDYTPNDNNSSMLLYCNIYIYVIFKSFINMYYNIIIEIILLILFY